MIIARAPLRVSFFGGGTDYPEYFQDEGGAVLGTAIDKFCYLTASPFLSALFDYSIRVSYRKVELVRSADEIEHNVYRACLKLCGVTKDVELNAVADLPAFTGLGSSSSFTVSLLHALHSFKGEFVRPHELACEAIHVERNLLGDRVGCQDQVLAAYGGLNVVEFRRADDFTVSRLPIPPQRVEELEAHLFLVFTGSTRKASEIVAQQLESLERNRPRLRRMRTMVDEGYNLLTGPGSLQAFGTLLHEAWTTKSQLDSSISNAEFNRMYRLGLEHGAWGGKLLGAGGGGFMLFVAPPEKHAALAEAFQPKPSLHVRINAPGSQIIFS